MESNKVVYIHRKKTDNSIFYVGMGNLKRAYSKQRSKWWKRVVDKYGYTIEIYKDGLTRDEACNLEIQLISEYGRIDLNNGQLINKTKGGITIEGMSNEIIEQKKKKLKSIVRTEEWRNKISLSHKGKIKSKEHIENIRKAMTGRKLPEKTKEKMRISNKSKIISSIPILCYDYNMIEYIIEFPSVREAARQLDCLETSISNNLNGRSKKVKSKKLNKNLKFKYKCH
jgi:hypothetical protein